VGWLCGGEGRIHGDDHGSSAGRSGGVALEGTGSSGGGGGMMQALHKLYSTRGGGLAA
jgi:hypothetical protein